MSYTMTTLNDSSQTLAYAEMDEVLDTPAASSPEVDDLEEDEYGIPIKYRDEIMALSKKVNKAVAKRWDEALAKRKDKKENI